jgi:branched-chain amino acid transport system permease protein
VSTVIQDVVNALSLGGVYALLALGLALVFSIMGLLNMAHSELITLGGYALFVLAGVPWPFAVLGAIGLVVIAALLMERVAFRPVRNASPITMLVTSFALGYLLQNVFLLVYGGLPRSVSTAPFLEESFQLGGLTFSRLSVVTLAVAALSLGGLAYLLQRTPTGIRMRAAAEDLEMARLVGVRANAVIASAFAISGFLAATGAVLLTIQSGVVIPTTGVALVLVAFVSTVLGGLGSLTGAALGGLLLGVLTVAFDALLPGGVDPYRDALLYTAVILVLLVRPQGLIVTRATVQRVG